ncbi:MAG: hypothetical protein C4341_07035 [Armatimonadota bacterium]
MRIAMVGVGMAAALALIAGQDTFLLRRVLEKGAKDAYTLTMKSSMVMDMGGAGMGTMPLDFAFTSKMDIAVDRVSTDGKDANVTIKMTEFKYDLGQMGQMMGGQQQPEMPQEITMAGKLDVRNRLSGVRIPNAPGAAAMLSQQLQNFPLFIEFPNDPVKVGDSWEVRLPATPMTGNKITRLKATLLGEKSALTPALSQGERGTAWAIKLSGTININADVMEMMRQMGGEVGGMPQMAMLMTGTMNVDGEALVEKATGRTIKFETTYKSDLTVDLPDMGMQMKQAGNTLVSVVLAN